MKLQGKVAIVTGAAQGIGRAYANRLAGEGATIAVLDLRADQANEVVKEIEAAGGKACAVVADVTSESQTAAVAKQVADAFGGIDILINNAALYYDMDMTDQTIDYFKRMLEVNVVSLLIMSRAVYPYMQQRGGGSIINISSTAAFPLPSIPPAAPPPTVPVSFYGVAKAGVLSLTRQMARQLGAQGIRVNAIAPGVTMSEATKKVVPGPVVENLAKASALQKVLDPYDLTGAALFLASDDSKMMTGQCLVVDAGVWTY